MVGTSAGVLAIVHPERLTDPERRDIEMLRRELYSFPRKFLLGAGPHSR